MKFESVPPAGKSSAERIKEYLERTKEAHEFDIAKLELSEDQLVTISDLIDLSEKARESIRVNNWGENEHARYEELRKAAEELMSSLDITSDESDAGMLAAFLNNKLTVVDLIDSRRK